MRDRKLRLALSIVSGRRNATNSTLSTHLADNLSNEELDLLGYDPYKFSYYGSPTDGEILEKCEDIVYEMINDRSDKNENSNM
jgi:hypothetical protein